MKVIYSYGSKFGVSGLATTVYHEVRALQQHALLQRLLCGFCGDTDFPRERIRALGLPDRVLRKLAAYDRSERLLHVQNVVYDAWASRQIEPADLFIAWSTWGLHSLRQAARLGMRTAIVRGSTDPRHYAAVLAEEYARWGQHFHTPPVRMRRKVAELDAADYVFTISAAARSTYARYGVPDSKLVTLPGRGADTRVLCPADRRRSGTFRALYVGVVSFGKGIAYLLEAWRQLRWPDAELHLVGGIDRDFRPLLARYQGLAGLHLSGHLPDPLSSYQHADIFVFPSLDEGAAKVTYEAMACGLPVITTAAAISEVRDGVEGFVVPVRDADALAQRLDQLRADDRLRRAMGQAARARAEAFTWEAYGRRFVDIVTTLAPHVPQCS